MRVFFAVDIDNDVKNEVEMLVESFKKIDDRIKWINVSNMHITLYFFGEIKEDVLSPLMNLIEKSLKEIDRFSISVRCAGGFPNIARPRVIWLGIENKSGELIKIQHNIQNLLKINSMGIRIDNRDFTPHLTLGRVKGRCNQRLINRLSDLQDENFGTFEVCDTVLYKSTLKSSGAVYEKIRVFQL